MKFRAPQNLTVVWLFALLLNAFSVAIFAETPLAPAEMVYCPLTKKLQPVKAAKKAARPNPLGEICADETTKKAFADELFAQNLLRTNAPHEEQFEKLVFDFFQKGKTAFADLPRLPDAPRKNSLKTFSAVTGFGKTDETQFLGKSTFDDFSPSQKPRPPTPAAVNLFESRNFRELREISRRIAPRAPPFSL